jgi:hypothetical protein
MNKARMKRLGLSSELAKEVTPIKGLGIGSVLADKHVRESELRLEIQKLVDRILKLERRMEDLEAYQMR